MLVESLENAPEVKRRVKLHAPMDTWYLHLEAGGAGVEVRYAWHKARDIA